MPKLLSLAFLTSTLAAVSSKADYVTAFDNTTNDYTRVLERVKKCENEGLFDLFQADSKLCFLDPRLNPSHSIRGISDKMLKDVNNPEGHLWLMLAHYGKYLGSAQSLTDRVSLSGIRRTVSGFTDEALAALPTKFHLWLTQLSTDQMRKVGDDVIAAFIANHQRGVRWERLFVSTINKLPDSVIDDHLDLISRTLTSHYSHLPLYGFRDSITKKLLSSDDYCESAAPRHIIGLGERKEKGALLRASCFAAASARFIDADCRRAIRYLPPHVTTAMQDGLPAKCLRFLTKEQVAYYGKDFSEREDQCEKLDITKLSPTALTGITANCFVSRFTNSGLVQPIFLHYSWRAIPTTHLSLFLERPEALKSIDKRDWAYMTIPQKQELVSKPDVCAELPVEFFLRRGGVTITKECFEKLTSAAQAVAFLFAHLPDNALANLDSVQSWVTPALGAAEEESRGFHVFNLAEPVKNVDQLIYNLSSSAHSHACSQIGTFEELEKYPVLQTFASEACIKAIGRDVNSLSTLTGLQPRIIPMLDLGPLMESIQRWDALDEEEFNVLKIHGAELGAFMSKPEIFEKLSEELLPLFTSDLVTAIKGWDKLNPKRVHKIKPEAFRHCIGQAPGYLTDEQFGQWGADVEGSNSPAANWSATSVGELSPGRVAQIKGTLWEAAPPSAYSGMTKETLVAVPAQAMRGMTMAQISQIPSATIHHINVQQAEEIGAKHDGKESSPLHYLARAGLPSGSQKTIQHRLSKVAK